MENKFNNLSEKEQLEIIVKHGELIAGLQDQRTRYQLFLVGNLYIEVVIDLQAERYKSIKIHN